MRPPTAPGTMLAFSISLRQRGSSASKSVGAQRCIRSVESE